MSNQEELSRSNEIGRLILQGKEKGYLTYEEVNDALPSNFVAPEQIDGLMNMFGENEIHVVDSDSAGEKLMSESDASNGKETPNSEGAPVKNESVSVDDPVRMYLREMGTISLLTREGEVTIAKKLRQGNAKLFRQLLTVLLHTKK